MRGHSHSTNGRSVPIIRELPGRRLQRSYMQSRQRSDYRSSPRRRNEQNRRERKVLSASRSLTDPPRNTQPLSFFGRILTFPTGAIFDTGVPVTSASIPLNDSRAAAATAVSFNTTPPPPPPPFFPSFADAAAVAADPPGPLRHSSGWRSAWQSLARQTALATPARLDQERAMPTPATRRVVRSHARTGVWVVVLDDITGRREHVTEWPRRDRFRCYQLHSARCNVIPYSTYNTVVAAMYLHHVVLPFSLVTCISCRVTEPRGGNHEKTALDTTTARASVVHLMRASCHVTSPPPA